VSQPGVLFIFSSYGIGKGIFLIVCLFLYYRSIYRGGVWRLWKTGIRSVFSGLVYFFFQLPFGGVLICTFQISYSSDGFVALLP